jgi:HSP20 family protein
MRLIPYRENEWPSLTLFQDEMNRLFEGFFPKAQLRTLTEWEPSVDVVETPETIVVKAEMPGIDAKDVDISVSGDVLILKGEKREEKEEKGKTWYRREIRSGGFTRSIPLPVPIDTARIQAEEHAGLITITLPRLEAAKAKKIPIKVKI